MNSARYPFLHMGAKVRLSDRNIKKLNTLNMCWNNVFHKVFQTSVWQSVKQIQSHCGLLDHTVHKN